MGDNGLDTSGKAAYTGMLEVLLAQQWQIEVHAWVDSLGDVFSELLKKIPGWRASEAVGRGIAKLGISQGAKPSSS